MPTTVGFRAEPRVEVVEREVFHDVRAGLAQDVDRPREQLLRIGVGRVCKSSKRNARACGD